MAVIKTFFAPLHDKSCSLSNLSSFCQRLEELRNENEMLKEKVLKMLEESSVRLTIIFNLPFFVYKVQSKAKRERFKIR